MECANYKAIKFALDMDSIKKFRIPEVYAKIDMALARRGFENEQSLEYVSKQKLLNADVWNVINNMLTELPWLKYCIKDISIKDTERQFDLPPLVSEEKAANEPSPQLKKLQEKIRQYAPKDAVSKNKETTMEDDYIME